MKKDKKKNKIVILQFRCTESEKKELLSRSYYFKSFSHYVRNVLIDNKVKGNILPPTEIIKSIDEIVLSINRVGNNVNQIAKYVNQRKGNISEPIMNEYNKRIKKLIKHEKDIKVLLQKIINKV